MSIQSMKETRRKGDSKRLDTIMALVVEAGDRLTLGRYEELINNVIRNATGLNKETSRATFRSECELVLHPDVRPYFSSILQLSQKVWDDRKTNDHSKYHIVMKICKQLKGGRYSVARSLDFIEKHYAAHGTLPL